MSNSKLVKFEEITPTLLRVAYFDGHLSELIGHLNLPIYGAYDGLDEMVFAFLTLPSGRTVTLGEYANSPRIGVDLYVDSKMEGIATAVYETCQQLGTPRERVVWFRDKFQTEIEQLFEEQGDIKEIEKESGIKNRQVIYKPITCFQHSLQIYDRAQFPEYWAMLQYNLGSAYYEAFKNHDGDRGRNLKWAIDCYYQSLEIHTQDQFPERWEIGHESLLKANISWFKYLEEGDIFEENLDFVAIELTGKGTDFFEFLIESIDPHTYRINISMLQQHPSPSFRAGFRIFLNGLISRNWCKPKNDDLLVLKKYQNSFHAWILRELEEQAEYEASLKNQIEFNEAAEKFSIGILSFL